MSWIQNFFTSRDNNTAGNTYVGQEGRLWYNPDTNALYVSDGNTVGGIPVSYTAVGNGIPSAPIDSVQYNAGAGNFGGDAFFTVDTANVSVLIGNLTLTSQAITGILANTDFTMGVATPGSGVVSLLGPLDIHSDSNVSNVATFSVKADGQVTALVPAPDILHGGVEIIGSASGVSVPPTQLGGMLHITGQNAEVSRIYNDGIANYPLYVGRRYNGLASAPTGILGGDVVSRLGSNPYLTDAPQFTPLGFAKIDFIATQDQTTTAQGSKIDFYTTPDDSTVQTITASFTTDRIALTGNLIPTIDNIYSLGNIDNRWIGGYFGNAGIYIEDTTLGTTGSMSLDNGIILFDTNISKLQVGNMWLTSDGIQHITAAIAGDILIGTTAGGNTFIRNAGIKFNDLSVQNTAAIPVDEKGNAFGVVPLNASTKIDTIYLPAGGPVYLGTWNATTNTPTLIDGTGTAGDLYIVSVGGTRNLGSGSIVWAIGDEAVYNGTIWQQVAAGAIGVTSFNSRDGVVTLNSGDVTNALSAGSIVNSKLLNSSITITAGTGLQTSNAVIKLGDTVTLTNTGVTSIIAGTGVAVDSATGGVTVTIGQPVGTANSVQFQSIASTTTIQATGNITGGNISTGGRVVTTGNITGGNLLTAGLISATGAVNSADGMSAVGNITGGNLIGQNLTATRVTFVGPSKGITDDAEFTYNSTTNVLSVGNISTAGNITGGNISVVGNIIGGNISVTGNITGGNVTKIVNGTSEANIGSTNGNANISIASTSNVVVVATTGLYTTGLLSVTGNVNGLNLNGGIISATGNITGGNLTINGISNLGGNANVVITGGTANYALVTNGSGVLSWSNIAGISGSVVQTVTTWVPALTATGGGTFTYSVQTGYYVKSGQSVSCYFTITITGAVGATGTIRISSLPVTSLNQSNNGGGALDNYSFAVLPSHVTGLVAASSTYMALYWHDRTGSTNTMALMTAADLGTSATLQGRITYISAT